MIGLILRGIALLLVLALVGLSVYAYVGNIQPDPQEIRVPVTIDGN